MGCEMLKHTPGPWSYIGDDDGDFVVFAGGEFVCNIGESPFAAVSEYPETTIVAFDTDQANARLISAAPDLLEACRELLSEAVILSEDYLECFDDYADDAAIQGWDKARWKRALAAAKKAKAAIAKAEGGE